MKSKVTLLLWLALIFGASNASAQGGMFERGFGPPDRMGIAGRLEFLIEELSLSDTQVAEIEALQSQARDQLRPLMEQMRDNRRALREVSGTNYDAAGVESLALVQGELAAALIVEKEATKARVLEVLTPEQRQDLMALLEERRGFGG